MKKIALIASVVILVGSVSALVISAQDATRLGQEAVAQATLSRVIAQVDSLKVVGKEEFPKDLTTEIHLGLQAFPFFGTEGTQGQLESATINVNRDTSVILHRKTGSDGSFVLQLFSSDKDGKVFSLFDIDLDGEWDVKKTTRDPDRNSIWLNGSWKRVDTIAGITSQLPTATAGTERYEFKHGWTRKTD